MKGIYINNQDTWYEVYSPLNVNMLSVGSFLEVKSQADVLLTLKNDSYAKTLFRIFRLHTYQTKGLLEWLGGPTLACISPFILKIISYT